MAKSHPASVRRQLTAVVLESLQADPPGTAGPEGIGGGKHRAFSFPLGEGTPLTGEARLDGEWLGLRGILPASGSGTPGGMRRPSSWKLLRATDRLSGGAKYALDQNGPFVAAEVHLEAAPDPARRIRDALAGLRSGAARLVGEKAEDEPASAGARSPDAIAEGAPARIRELCEKAGWPFEERSGGRFCSRLERPTPVPADLECTPAGAFRLQVELALLQSDLPNACREALGSYLLSVNGSLRLARVALRSGPRGLAANLEVSFESLPCPEELAVALSAASVGHAICAAETRILASDEECARMFLAQCGPFENSKEV